MTWINVFTLALGQSYWVAVKNSGYITYYECHRERAAEHSSKTESV